MTDKKVVKGVIALFIDTDGNEIAHAADFAANSYGGFDLKQAQKIRAKNKLLDEVCGHFFYGDYCTQISKHTMECVLRDLSCKNKIEFYYIGHND